MCASKSALHRLHQPQIYPGLKPEFFFPETDGWTDVSSGPNRLMLKEGDMYAPGNIQVTQACDCSITWTAGGCFAVIFAMRGPSIRMFGHLFVDAEPASD
jgi:hypothetical protein